MGLEEGTAPPGLEGRCPFSVGTACALSTRTLSPALAGERARSEGGVRGVGGSKASSQSGM